MTRLRKNASHAHASARNPNAPTCAVAAEKKKKDKDDEPKKNMCPHCKKFHCKKPHQVEPDKCMWNKKYKGYRFKSICDELKVAFKPRHKFAAKLGGYASKDNESEDD